MFEGKSFGADCDSIGELVFTTSVVGYTEALTDERYFGQTVLFTFPMMGNYGINESDREGLCKIKGCVVREICDKPSNFRMEKTLGEYLKEQGVPGICGVDTRALTRLLRDGGTVNAAICHSIPDDITAIKNYKVENAVAECTVKERFTCGEDNKIKVTMIDYGGNHSMIKALTARGCRVDVVPADTSAEEILKDDPDGILLSCGGGNPAENSAQIEEIKKLYGKKPLLAIGLGHQMLAIAKGAAVERMNCGSHGSNVPAKHLESGRTYIVNANHCYTVMADSIKAGEISFVNANSGDCMGINYGENAISVQFVPDSVSGSYGTSFVYDRFVALMEDKKYAVR